MRKLILLATVAILAGCERPHERTLYLDPKPVAALAADATTTTGPADAAAAPAAIEARLAPNPAASPPAAALQPPAGAPMMAYSYAFGLEADPWKVRGLEGLHERACLQAGPAQCVVTASSVDEEGKDRVSADLKLRASPAWLARFRAGLAGDVDRAGGKLTHQEVTSEDLSRQIVDNEAALRAKTTLRDRLQQILATRPGKVSDLLEVETNLSDVLEQIDTANSELGMMRQRVATSEVEITYQSAGVLAPQGVFAPLWSAVTDFVGILVVTLAAMVRLVAWLTPWAAALAGLLWVFRKRLAKWRWPFGHKAAAQ